MCHPHKIRRSALATSGGALKNVLCSWLLPLVFLWSSAVTGAERNVAGRRYFDDNVLPILARQCFECHDSKAGEAGLDLSSFAGLLVGSNSGTVVVPGSAGQSLLVQVLADDAEPHMPPQGQLSGDEVAAIRRWIDALDASTKVGLARQDEQDADHWAFRPVERPALPIVSNASWTRRPIDVFVLARLEQAGLMPSPAADKATLLRRVYFDLVGLPPSVEELSAFLKDQSPGAYERVVDRLLASPRYGERWGRHWLDLARYADSSGFHNDFDRPHAWRYRDYVIRSFNTDKPYSQFIREQIAGDELSHASMETWIATGFGRNGPSNEDNMGSGLAEEKYRLDQLDGVVSTTSNVFLGLTLGCARCHDHKYDPLTQRDYYRFLAFFNSTAPQQLSLDDFQPGQPKLKPFGKPDAASPAAMVLTDHGRKMRTTNILWRGDVRTPGPVVQPGAPAVFGSSPRFDSSTQRRRSALAAWIAHAENPLTWRVMANRVWHYHFGRGLVATPSNFGRLGERPTHPELLDWLAAELRDGGSLKSLHRLIVTSAVYRQTSQANQDGLNVDPENRLLWRMKKRRLEAEPLRDAFLCVSGNLNLEMVGPGVKPRIRPDLLVASQRNKWPLVRREGPEHWRRSVYVYVKRQLQLPLLELFDAPATTHSCARRDESLVPTQCLVLMNDEFTREQAGYFADRVAREVGDDPRAQAERALLIALSHEPEDSRINEGMAFLKSQTQQLIGDGQSEAAARRDALADFCHVLMNLSEFVYVD